MLFEAKFVILRVLKVSRGKIHTLNRWGGKLNCLLSFDCIFT